MDIDDEASLKGSAVFLVNVGVNTGQSARARSPRFTAPRSNRCFCVVPFFDAEGMNGVRPYDREFEPFLNPAHLQEIAHFSHADPDWSNATYGDCLHGGRAAALVNATKGDILLFWGLLYDNTGETWETFTNHRGWYLFGVLRIRDIIAATTDLACLDSKTHDRVIRNVHLSRAGLLPPHDVVFVGDPESSCLFHRAVDLGVYEDDGLLYQVFHSANGARLQRNGQPRWYCSLRSCRKVLDLTTKNDAQRVRFLRERIERETSFDILSSNSSR